MSAAVVEPTPVDTAPSAPRHSIRVGSQRYPLLPPNPRDSRLHVAMTLLSVQVLGQVALGFELSIAQILLSLGTCAVLEVAIAFWERRVIAWPASAMLTGNGVALLLRVPGTEHGDWWSLRGGHIFVAVAALSLLSKYLIRVGDRHLFNPSNLGLVVAFLVLGSPLADPQDLWWGNVSVGLVAAYAVILAGGLLIGARTSLLAMAVAYWAAFAAGTGVLSAGGHCMRTRWSIQPVCGTSYWWVLVSSPEILIFLFFMITDPRTVPRSGRGRVVHGLAVGLLGPLLAAPQTTEFATKVAILAALTLTSLARPLIDRRWPAGDAVSTTPAAPGDGAARSPSWTLRIGAAVVLVVGYGAAVVAAGAPARTAADVAGTPQPSQAAVSTPRPTVDLDRPAPPVQIDAAVRTFAAALTQRDADRIGRQVVEDLVIEADAVATRDDAKATTALTGRRLEQARRRIAGTATAADPAPARYVAERLRLVIVRDPVNFQAPPTLGVEVSGTRSPLSPDGDTTSPASPGERFTATFLVVDTGESALISDQAAPTPR